MPKTRLQKHTLNLREGDFERLAELHPDLKPAFVIRTLVASHVDKQAKTVLEEIEVELQL